MLKLVLTRNFFSLTAKVESKQSAMIKPAR